MWDAIHKETEKPYFAYKIWEKFNKPHDEKWICCPICKKPVTPVVKHIRVIHNEKIYIPSFFKLFDGVGGCISHESDEHKMGKIIIATLVENNKAMFKIKNKKINLVFKSVPNISYRWEQHLYNRRADVLFILEKWNNIIGNGIVFEIAITEKKRSLVKKTIDWIKRGYSVCWLFKEDFRKNSLKEEYININYPFGLYRDIVKLCNDVNWSYKAAKNNGGAKW